MTIHSDNKLATILDFDNCRTLVAEALEREEPSVILCPHYSINILAKYGDIQELVLDMDELGEYVGGYYPEVSDFEDLVINFIAD